MTLHPLTGEVLTRGPGAVRSSRPRHYVAGPERMERAIRRIEAELAERLADLRAPGQAARGPAAADAHDVRPRDDAAGRASAPASRTTRSHMDGRSRGTAPHTLLDYFPDDFLLVDRRVARHRPADRRHVRGRHVPQAQPRGPRLPAARARWTTGRCAGTSSSNRIGQTVYLSATPGKYELGKAQDGVVEQIIRPTGLVDPQVVVKPTKGQIDDLLDEIRTRAEKDERVLVTTLTKKMAEDLTDYLLDARHPASATCTPRSTPCERVELLRDLRLGRLRRPGRHQPAPRGPRPAGGVAGQRSWTPTRRASCARTRR